MSKTPVVVTGMGIVSALGVDLGAFSAGLRAGRSGVRKQEHLASAGVRSDLCADAAEPEFPEGLALPKYTSRPDRFGLRAAL